MIATKPRFFGTPSYFVAIIVAGYILLHADFELYNIASGTGTHWGGFSEKWGAIYAIFTVLLLLAWLALAAVDLNPWRSNIITLLLAVRERIGVARWGLIIVSCVFPIWLLQYTAWGVVFNGTYLRLLIWFAAVLFGSFLAERDSKKLIRFSIVLIMLLVSAALIAAASSLGGLSSYPFSLGWSEGNRMWDYSLLFGKHLYIFDRDAGAYIDIGRQFSGGLPFLLPSVTIYGERLWLAVMDVLPYVLLGWLSFSPSTSKAKYASLLAGLLGYLFLTQGPIHTPLLWSAILVALAWRRPIWAAAPLLAISAYVAQASRFTWMFAPAIWVVMLELGSVASRDSGLPKKNIIRAIALGAAGLFGGYIVPMLPALFQGAGTNVSAANGVTINTIAASISSQPLLWYRLFPNATFGSGILLGLLIAIGPLGTMLIDALVTKRWSLNTWQKLVLLLPMLAFLVVGLIVSVKIGGGGDLHNLDMFLIAFMFIAAIAWRAIETDWTAAQKDSSALVGIIALFIIANTAVTPLLSLRPLTFAGDVNWVARLADAKSANALGLLPSTAATTSTLDLLRTYVADAKTHGDVLFMDQRQLLTFGYIQDVTLIAEYEKKLMMDKALSSDAAYFQPFYRDLAAHRFSLIISDPLRAPIKDSDYQFGEENNAWVKWVAKPVLCYYDPIETLPDFRLQLLVPKQTAVDCSKALPPEAAP